MFQTNESTHLYSNWQAALSGDEENGSIVTAGGRGLLSAAPSRGGSVGAGARPPSIGGESRGLNGLANPSHGDQPASR